MNIQAMIDRFTKNKQAMLDTGLSEEDYNNAMDALKILKEKG